MELNETTATLTLSGPATKWFGASFGAHAMADQPWTVVVDGEGTVTEHKLAKHAPGTVLAPSVTVVSHQVAEGRRTVVLTRALQGSTQDYFTFSMAADDSTIPILTAVGSGAAYAYHKDKTLSTITMLPVASAGACVCPEAPKAFGQAAGKLVYHAVANQSADTGTGAVGFSPGKCIAAPGSDLIAQGNPTCDIRHYRGGQWACHHMWSLLDADQVQTRITPTLTLTTPPLG